MFDQQQTLRYRAQLDSAINELGLDVTTQQSEDLIRYLELLAKWNKAYNLTSVRNPDDMLYRHIVDSLSIAPYVSGERIIDVGTGPGLPGIPMAILNPNTQFVLLDSNGKKTRFLTQCLIEMSLPNVEIFNGRVEQANFEARFDLVLSRAFTALDNMVDICKHLLTDSGKFLAMKGLDPETEKQNIDQGFAIEDIIPLNVPGCEAQRHLIIIGKSET